MRGRVLVDRLFLQRFGQFPPVPVRYEEFTSDIPLNQILAGALDVALQLTDGELAQRAFHLRGQFDGILPRRMVGRERIVIPARAAHFTPAHRLAELLLSEAGVAQGSAGAIGLSFLVDMNRLFEDYVGKVLEDVLRPLGFSVRRHELRYLDDKSEVQMQPDFMILDPNTRPVALADAKYKRTAKARSNDAYQAYSYARGFDISEVWLLYASANPTTSVLGGDVRLVTASTDLVEGPKAVAHAVRSLVESRLGASQFRAESA